MRIGVLKNLLLALLVGLSVVLSWVLWQGNWLRDADLAVSPNRALEAADSPDLDHAIQPVISVYLAKPALASVVTPGTSAWDEWYARLRRPLAGPFRPVAAPSVSDTLRVSYEFPVPLDELPDGGGLPLPSQLPFAWTGSAVWLVQTQDKAPVYLTVRTQAGWYGAPVSEPAGEVREAALQAVTKAPWVPLVSGGSALVPRDGAWLPLTTWTTRKIPLPPLVHAFFVNPEVATRIQSGPDDVIWTDGSRLVRYQASRDTMVYEDPVVGDSRNESPARADPETAAAFIRNHGGAPDDIRLWAVVRTRAGGGGEVVFREWVDGYPVLDAPGTYRVTMAGSQVIRYEVPVTRRAARKASASVHVIGAQALRQAIQRNWPKANLAGVVVTLGYRSVPGHEGLQLVPTFDVSLDGTTLGAIDATSGEPVKGWSGG